MVNESEQPNGNGEPKPKDGPTLAIGGAEAVYFFKPRMKDITVQELTACMTFLVQGVIVAEGLRLAQLLGQGLPVVNQMGEQIGAVPGAQIPGLAPPAVIDAAYLALPKGAKRHIEVVSKEQLAEAQKKQVAVAKKPGIILPR